MKISLKTLFLIYNATLKRNFVGVFLFFLLILATNAQENSFKEITTFKEFKSYKITAIAQDTFNNIWLATNKGLLKFNGISITNYDFKIGESSQETTKIYAKNDTLFIGKNKNLYLKTPNKLISFNAKKITKFFKHKKNLFIGTNEGIYRFKKDYLQPLKITNNIDFSIINDIIFYNTFFYIATNNGVWKVDKLYKPTKIIKLKNGNFNSFLALNSSLLIIKNNNSIIEIKKDDTFLERYAHANILKTDQINNQIYISTKNDGILVLDKTNFNFLKRINKYNSNLKSNRICGIFEDTEKNIFVATENNLYLKKNNKVIEKPALAITDIAINYVSIDSITPYNYNKTLQLETNQNNVSFRFENVSISAPKKIEYRYKLKDHFSLWNNATRIDFSNLKYGKYNFIVESRFKNSDKISRKNFIFYIDRPLYKKTWFVIITIAFFFFLLAFFVELYIRKINRKNTQKVNKLQLENYLLNLEQKALQLQMNPHFIFNVLNGIKALGNSGKTKELNTTISQFSILLRSILNNSRLEEVSLKDEIEILKNYLDLEQKMSSKKFEYTIKTTLNNTDAAEILIPPMLVQPFIENSIKHGINSILKDGKIAVNFEVKQRSLHCTIIDNGIGFYESKKGKEATNHKSIALEVTQERIKNISKNSTFKIEELKKEQLILGTKVHFKIPLKTDF